MGQKENQARDGGYQSTSRKKGIFCVSFGCFYLDTTQRLSAVRVQMHDKPKGNSHLLPVGSVLPQHCRMKPGGMVECTGSIHKMGPYGRDGGFTNDLGKEGIR